MNIKLGFEGLTKFILGKDFKWEFYLIQIFGLSNLIFLMMIKYILIYLYYVSLLPFFLILELSLIGIKKKKKREKSRIVNVIENKIANFKIKQAKYLEKKSHCLLKKSFLKKITCKISQFRDALDLFYLRIYINKALNKILTDTNLRKLIKSEILNAPRGTFSEFLNLYNELRKEFKTLFQVERKN
ncbi:MAG: hypothetical protein ACFFC9_05270 [Promethearchaeota archaeon]